MGGSECLYMEDKRVDRNASAPHRSMTSSGSTTWPFVFDILWPSLRAGDLSTQARLRLPKAIPPWLHGTWVDA